MKIYKKNITLLGAIAGAALLTLSGCGIIGGGTSDNNTETFQSETTAETTETPTEATTISKNINGLEWVDNVDVNKSMFFDIASYKDGYYLITVQGTEKPQQMLIVPEGKEAPDSIEKNVILVKQPVTSSRVDSVSLISLMEKINPEYVDRVSLVASEQDSITMKKIVDNMEKGITQYSGSVTKPNVELISNKKPQIYLANPELHKNEIYNELVDSGIQPFITYFHKEEDPFGRIEWVKVLGAIFGDLESAEKFYSEQVEALGTVDVSKVDNKKFTMFCIKKDNDTAYVRKADDVIAKMGIMAGAENMLTGTTGMGWEEMPINDFMERFKDSDYLIYMDKHGDDVNALQDLEAMSDKIKEFKAYKEGNILKTADNYLYMTDYGYMIQEMNDIFSDSVEDAEDLNYFVTLE